MGARVASANGLSHGTEMPLNLTKIAYGAQSLAHLQAALAVRAPHPRLTTRYRPKRDGEIAGGSLYWIIAHRIVARSPILAFETRSDGKTDIVIAAQAIPVRPYPRRAHQGWRYLEGADAPPDLGDIAGEGDELPDEIKAALAEIALD
jgi:hypothetical protein